MGKWYKQGFQDALDGICDPPWQQGHRDHTNYMEGHADGDRELSRIEYEATESSRREFPSLD
jgi:hypothetical protein